MSLYKNLNGVDIPLTQEEIDDYNQRQEIWNKEFVARTTVEFKKELAAKIDAVANEKEYDSATSCASYAASSKLQWQKEAIAFISWRDTAFSYAFDYLSELEAGSISNPDLISFLKGIPKIEWPPTEESFIK